MADNNSLVKKWIQYCQSQGLQKEAAAAKLQLTWFDYRYMINGQRAFPQDSLDKMDRIIEGRDIMDQTVLRTSLLVEMEEAIKKGMSDKMMITLACPTGQGKTISAKYLARQHKSRYLQILVELQKEKKAAIKNFIRELNLTYDITERWTNNLRRLIGKIETDARQTLIIDEAQRLITEDWGYFKVLQDLLDNVSGLSIILLGNYQFYEDMFTDASVTYKGIADQEQFLRRFSIVQKLPRLQKSDVKLWADYNGIPLSPSDHKRLAEFFSKRAALSDLENIRKEIIRVMGRGELKEWADVDSDTIISIYKAIHSKTQSEGQTNNEEEKSYSISKSA
jgi:AAA domain